jgi:hypothetical protein
LNDTFWSVPFMIEAQPVATTAVNTRAMLRVSLAIDGRFMRAPSAWFAGG